MFSKSIVVAKLRDLSGIIELDHLVKHNVLIDASNDTLCSPHFDEVSLLNKDHLHSRCPRGHLAETVCVPGSSDMFVLDKITDKFLIYIDALFEQELDDKLRNRILMTMSVVKTNNTFSVFNPAIIFKKNAVMARLQTNSLYEFANTCKPKNPAFSLYMLKHNQSI